MSLREICGAATAHGAHDPNVSLSHAKCEFEVIYVQRLTALWQFWYWASESSCGWSNFSDTPSSCKRQVNSTRHIVWEAPL